MRHTNKLLPKLRSQDEKGNHMKYMGSKSRIAKKILPIIQKYVDASKTKIYYEPFCGGCNVIEHINAKERRASDLQPYLIALLQNLDKLESLPAFVDKEHYAEVRESFHKIDGKFPDWYIGAVGFLASYNGRFFDGGYAGLVHTKAGTTRDYYAEALRNLKAQSKDLMGVHFACADYRDILYIPGSVIYCDPPYHGVKQYGINRCFDHDSFWAWVRRKSKENVVLVSEHTAPDDFCCVWEQPVKRTIDNHKRVAAVEKLWRLEGDGK